MAAPSHSSVDNSVAPILVPSATLLKMSLSSGALYEKNAKQMMTIPDRYEWTIVDRNHQLLLQYLRRREQTLKALRIQPADTYKEAVRTRMSGEWVRFRLSWHSRMLVGLCLLVCFLNTFELFEKIQPWLVSPSSIRLKVNMQSERRSENPKFSQQRTALHAYERQLPKR